jgi:hypothetical protein
VSTTGVPGDSRLAEVLFQAAGSAGDSSVLDVRLLAMAGPEGEAIEAGALDGLIAIGAASGDVNCDGSTNAVDAMFILQREVGLRPDDSDSCPQPERGLYRPGCDVSRDGLCNVIDALLIMQCEAGVANPFCPSASVAGAPGEKPIADSAVLSVDSGSVAPGETVVVRLWANLGETELAAATAAVQYDPDVLRPRACGVDPGRAFDLAVCNIAQTADKVGFAAVSAGGVSGQVTLAEITFEAVGAEGDSSPLTVWARSFADPGGRDVEVAPRGGHIDIRERGTHRLHLPLVKGQ